MSTAQCTEFHSRLMLCGLKSVMLGTNSLYTLIHVNLCHGLNMERLSHVMSGCLIFFYFIYISDIVKIMLYAK